MISADPFIDNAGGTIVLKVEIEGEAKAIVVADPVANSGFRMHEIRMWTMVPCGNYLNQ